MCEEQNEQICENEVVKINNERRRWDDSTCYICRNELNDVCNVCHQNFISDPENCPVVTGVCGHSFHAHCISHWVRYCESRGFRATCPAPCDSTLWVERT